MRRIIMLVTLAGRRLAGDGVPFVGLRYPRVLVLSATFTAAMVVGLLAYAPSARADAACGDPPFANVCLEKTGSADPVKVGEPLTFTITQQCKAEICVTAGQITDTLPAGLEFRSASATGYTGPEAGNPPPPTCSESAGTVTCNNVISFINTEEGIDVPAVVTIEVIPRQCGTFTNTASLPGFGLSVSETFTVVQCPPPTKEECKKGGWSNPALGFPDQGTCISAVNRQNRQ